MQEDHTKDTLTVVTLEQWYTLLDFHGSSNESDPSPLNNHTHQHINNSNIHIACGSNPPSHPTQPSIHNALPATAATVTTQHSGPGGDTSSPQEGVQQQQSPVAAPAPSDEDAAVLNGHGDTNNAEWYARVGKELKEWFSRSNLEWRGLITAQGIEGYLVDSTFAAPPTAGNSSSAADILSALRASGSPALMFLTSPGPCEESQWLLRAEKKLMRLTYEGVEVSVELVAMEEVPAPGVNEEGAGESLLLARGNGWGAGVKGDCLRILLMLVMCIEKSVMTWCRTDD